MAQPKSFDLMSKNQSSWIVLQGSNIICTLEIEALKERLEDDRLEYHKARIDAEKSHHKLVREADKTFGRSIVQRQRVVGIHEKRKQHYERIFGVHKQRIREILDEIERQVRVTI